MGPSANSTRIAFVCTSGVRTLFFALSRIRGCARGHVEPRRKVVPTVACRPKARSDRGERRESWASFRPRVSAEALTEMINSTGGVERQAARLRLRHAQPKATSTPVPAMTKVEGSGTAVMALRPTLSKL